MAVGKRKAKRTIRAMSEGTEALDETMNVLRQAGYQADFAWQLPDIIRQLVGQAPTGSAGFGSPGAWGSSQIGLPPRQPMALPGPAPTHRSPADAMAALSQARTGNQAQPRPQPRQQPRAAPQPSQNLFEEDSVDPSINAGLFEEFGGGEEEAQQNGLDVPDMGEMMAIVKDGQQRMMSRVATEGVKYGHGMKGPASGQRLVPHESVSRRGAANQASQEDELTGSDENFGVPGLGLAGEDEDGQGYDELPASPDDAKYDEKTGMSVGEKRRIMAQVLGRAPAPPTPGRPNTGFSMGAPGRRS